jgi:four helix bundle protein
VAANIAEGLGRGTQGDFERFLRIASGSMAELEVLIDLARDLGELDEPSARDLLDAADTTRRKLTNLVTRVAAQRN